MKYIVLNFIYAFITISSIVFELFEIKIKNDILKHIINAINQFFTSAFGWINLVIICVNQVVCSYYSELFCKRRDSDEDEDLYTDNSKTQISESFDGINMTNFSSLIPNVPNK